MDGNIGEFYEISTPETGPGTTILDHLHKVPEITYGNEVVTANLQGYSDIDKSRPLYAVYNEKFEVIKELYDSDAPDSYGLTYRPSKKCWYFNKDEGFYTANEDFSQITKLADFDLREYFVLEDKIVYYRTVYNYSAPKNNADIFGIMELDGNVISETKEAPYGSGHFRFGKAGDIIYFMSWQQFDMSYFTEFPMDRMIFYNCKTGEQKMFYPENDNENTFCAVTPNGKYLVTGILDTENHYTINDVTINLYDINSGEMLESEALGTGDEWFAGMSVYNDRVLFMGIWQPKTYQFKSQ